MENNRDNEEIIEIEIVNEESTKEDRRQEAQADSRGMYKDYGSYYEKPEDKTGEGFGIASLVLGCVSLVSMCCLPIAGMLPSILAIVFGALGLKAINRGMAIAGLSMGIVTLLPQLLFVALLIGRSLL